MCRPEVGELSLSGETALSTMSHLQNPMLAIDVRSAALAAPMLGAQLHLAAVESVDERPDGAWHLDPASYLGAAGEIVRAICDRAEATLKELR